MREGCCDTVGLGDNTPAYELFGGSATTIGGV